MRVLRVFLIVAGVLGAVVPAKGQRPALVVFVAIDQMRPDYFTAFGDQLTGGLARLWREGAVFTNAFQDHANTETAPGHATMLSGRFPYSTGITANSIGVNTPDAPLLQSTDTGASPFRFRGTTLADWMKARNPDTRVLSVSRKDRSAILPVAPSRTPTVLWYSPRAGIFTTSTWYAEALPAWVTAFNTERPASRFLGASWDLLLPVTAYAEADDVVTEGRTNRVFPHVLTTDTTRIGAGIVESPWMDSLTLALAWRGLRAMDLGGSANRTDLLSVSLSSTDAIGHRWGPDSRELHDQILRVDKYLGAFFDSLFALRGRDRVIIALTSDHGVAPVPGSSSRFGENSTAQGVPTATFRPALIEARATLRAAGLDTTAIRWEDLVLFLDRNKLNGAAFDPGPMMWKFAAALRENARVARVDTFANFARADTTKDAVARRWSRMFTPGADAFPGVSALLAATLQPYDYYGSTTQATHGSVHDYDAHVPVVFLGRPFVSGRIVTKVNVVDIAPTLAHVLGITPLETLDGRVLREALR
jgi:predicted AlkP superfamily pyrophosphatase or phosphodiesterase